MIAVLTAEIQQKQEVAPEIGANVGVSGAGDEATHSERSVRNVCSIIRCVKAVKRPPKNKTQITIKHPEF